VQQLDVDVVGQTKKTHCLVLDLCDEGLVALVLVGYQLGDEVLAVSLSNGFRLGVEHISEVIVILLLGSSHLDEWEDIESWGEEDLGAGVDASDVL